jgi:alpha-N-arabinofuranosidase
MIDFSNEVNMRITITLLILSGLLCPTVYIAAQDGKLSNTHLSDQVLKRKQQAARTPLLSDKTTLENLARDVIPNASTVAVNVDSTKVIRTLDSQLTGINAAVWDSSFESQTTKALLESMGTKILRFPGGSLSDEYHWQTNTTLNNTWQWATSFDDFAAIAKSVNSQAIITANYGTGTADEAAAWVKYANVTQNYGFKYWEIGNENYGTWETDHHTATHDPYTYALQARDYITKMKAEDPSIKVGVVVTTGEESYVNNRSHPATNPRTGAVHNGWTPVLLATLKSLNVIPDFVIYHRYEQNPTNESDAGLLQSAATWKNDAADLRKQLSDYLGNESNNVQIICTENNSVSFDPGKQSTSLVNGLFLADSIGNLVQTEFNIFVWWDLRNGYLTNKNNSSSLYGWRLYGDYGITSVDHEPYPAYYIFKLLSHFATPSDSVLEAKSQSPLLAAYATKGTDGRLRLMLINKSPSEEITARVNITGYTPSSAAVVYSYGKAQDDAAKTLTGSPDIKQTVFQGASNNFDYTVPAYSVTLLSMLPQTSDFEIAMTPSSQAINIDGEARFDITAAFAPDLTEPVSITAQADEGRPLNISISQSTVTPSQPATLVVSPRQGSPLQSYNITLKATAAGIERTAKTMVTLLDPPVISTATYVGKILTINVRAGSVPRVFINGVEHTDKIKNLSESEIIVKGKKGILGLVAGDNRIRVVRGQAASTDFILRR